MITIYLLYWQVYTLQSYIVLFHWNYYQALKDLSVSLRPVVYITYAFVKYMHKHI